MSLPGSYKKFRRVIRYIISIVILLLIIVGAAAVGLRLYFNDQRLRAKLMHAAESYLNGQLDVGELDISIFSSISINDLYLLSETDTIFV